jgi:hypothetical protein
VGMGRLAKCPERGEGEVMEEEEEAQECRVCRGEGEEGRPLYSPCMCAGSIMYTHQVSNPPAVLSVDGDLRCF